jgi:soluble lytic murein transglycosylase-like protein
MVNGPLARAARTLQKAAMTPPFLRSAALALAGLGLAVGLQGCAPTADMSPTASIESGEDVPKGSLDERIAHYAAAYEVPESLIRRSIRRESGYNPLARNGPYWGLMQIRYDTARGMGYRGSARGLLNADTNLKYAARYLANAWVCSGGNEDRAIALYAGGYFYVAKRKHMLDQMKLADTED